MSDGTPVPGNFALTPAQRARFNPGVAKQLLLETSAPLARSSVFESGEVGIGLQA